MRSKVFALIIITSLLVGARADAAKLPKLSGNYIVTVTNTCAAQITQVQDMSGTFLTDVVDNGNIQSTLELYTFSGNNVNITGTQIQSSLILVNGPAPSGTPVGQFAKNKSGTFSQSTSSTNCDGSACSTLTINTGSPKTYTAMYGSVTGGIAHQVHLVGLDTTNNTSCVQTGLMLRQ